MRVFRQLLGRSALVFNLSLLPFWQTEIYKSSRLVSTMTGMMVQPNKAIVGANAFAHESGIHQDGVLKNRATYEIMSAELVGIAENSLVLGKHSGRAAFRSRLVELGYDGLSEEDLQRSFLRFKELADKKKEVSSYDIESIVNDEIQFDTTDRFVLEDMVRLLSRLVRYRGAIPTAPQFYCYKRTLLPVVLGHSGHKL